ncbi:MAG: c-type cytochrome [Myxococcota bacterium]
MKIGYMTLVWTLCAASLTTACGKAPGSDAPDPADGPVTIVVPDNLDDLVADGDAKKGEALFATKGCRACHLLTAVKLVGPGLEGVGKRRSVRWMARMMLKPEVMVKEDPQAKLLLGIHMVAMANQNVAVDTELPHLLAFLKTR